MRADQAQTDALSISSPISPIISTRAVNESSEDIIEASFSMLQSVFFILYLIFVSDAKVACTCAKSWHKYGRNLHFFCTDVFC